MKPSLSIAFALLAMFTQVACRGADRTPSAIIVIVDDLAQTMLDRDDVLTPNIDTIAAEGVYFRKAQAHVPECHPSRISTWSGLAADETGIVFNKDWKSIEPVLPEDHKFLFDYVKSQTGGKIKGTGKVYHNRVHDFDKWSDWYEAPDFKRSIADLEVNRSKYSQAHDSTKLDWGPGDEGGRADDEITTWAVKRIEGGFLDRNPGSLLAVGIYRPHLPFVVPQKFFDLYPPVLKRHAWWSDGATNWKDNFADLDDEPERAHDMGNTKKGYALDEFDEHDDFMRAYAASVSFADYQIGRIIEAWRRTENTYLIIVSDHGWQFGEKGRFAKAALWESSLRIPMIFAGPGITGGRVIDDPVSLLDLYPTVVSLLGLDIPGWAAGNDLSGVLLHGEAVPSNPVVSIFGDTREKRWFSVRNADGRLIKYDDGSVSAYEHATDPHEHVNVGEQMARRLFNALSSALD